MDGLAVEAKVVVADDLTKGQHVDGEKEGSKAQGLGAHLG